MGVDEVQVATDTLFTTASYRKAGRAALETIDRPSRDGFVNALREELEPYFDVCGEHCRRCVFHRTLGKSPGISSQSRAEKAKFRPIPISYARPWTLRIGTQQPNHGAYPGESRVAARPAEPEALVDDHSRPALRPAHNQGSY